nr:MAG TPA: hypothetical protein [Caudoviricetes sp.]
MPATLRLVGLILLGALRLQRTEGDWLSLVRMKPISYTQWDLKADPFDQGESS